MHPLFYHIYFKKHISLQYQQKLTFLKDRKGSCKYVFISSVYLCVCVCVSNQLELAKALLYELYSYCLILQANCRHAWPSLLNTHAHMHTHKAQAVSQESRAYTHTHVRTQAHTLAFVRCEAGCCGDQWMYMLGFLKRQLKGNR